jgi:hypothetical protein
MASIAVATLKRIAPQYADRGDDELGEWIALALNFVSASVYGSSFNLAVAYVAAALMFESDVAGSGAAGPLIGRRAGEVSENYANTLMSARTRWESNPFGRMFLNLRDASAGTKPFTTSALFTGGSVGGRGRCGC